MTTSSLQRASRCLLGTRGPSVRAEGTDNGAASEDCAGVWFTTWTKKRMTSWSCWSTPNATWREQAVSGLLLCYWFASTRFHVNQQVSGKKLLDEELANIAARHGGATSVRALKPQLSACSDAPSSGSRRRTNPKDPLYQRDSASRAKTKKGEVDLQFFPIMSQAGINTFFGVGNPDTPDKKDQQHSANMEAETVQSEVPVSQRSRCPSRPQLTRQQSHHSQKVPELHRSRCPSRPQLTWKLSHRSQKPQLVQRHRCVSRPRLA